MKEKRAVPLVLTFTSFYLCGIVLGIIFISYLPQAFEHNSNEWIARQAVSEYEATGNVSSWKNDGIAILMYKDGDTFYRYIGRDNTTFTMNMYYQTHALTDKVMEDGIVHKLHLLVKDNSTLGYCSRLYIGRKIDRNGEVYAVFWVKEITDLPEMLLGFFVAFSITYVAAITAAMLNRRTQRKYIQLQKNYISNITHELKSPIASIKAIVEALTDGVADDESVRLVYYGKMLQEMNQLQMMIQQSLDLSRFQSKVDNINYVILDTGEFIDELRDKYGTFFELTDIEFNISSEVYRMPNLFVSKKRLTMAFSTILDNALKYVPEGGHVTIDAARDKKYVTFSISDDGSGIDKKDLPYIFDRFYRANRSDEIAGSGLGLAIAREAIESMKGKIWVDSELGKGSTMHIKLPIARV